MSVEGCTRTEPSYSHTPWRCVLAEGHVGEHRWQIEREHGYLYPLDDLPSSDLRSEVRVLLHQLGALKKDIAADPTADKFSKTMRQLVDLAPANSKRKTLPLADVQAIWEEMRS